MLVVVMLAIAGSAFAHLKYSEDTTTFLGGLFLGSFLLIIVGTWAGYYTRSTKNGRGALILSYVTIVVFGLFCLLPTLFRYL